MMDAFNGEKLANVFNQSMRNLRRLKAILRVIAVVALAGHSAEAIATDSSWMLTYAGRSTNALIWDQRTNGVVKESLPRSLSSSVLNGLGGPPNPIFVVGSTLSASACVAHSCPDKGFFWIDTASGSAFGASVSLWACDGGEEAGLRCELLLGSRRFKSFQSIPAAGKQALMEWMNEQEIRVTVVKFIDGANKTAPLNPTDFQPVERFNQPSTGPSFNCRMAHDQIENAICGNEQLAALDLEMADQYRRMHVSYDTVGNREQLRDLQRMWLANRKAACPNVPGQIQCLEAEYRRQHDALEHWVPNR